MLRFSHNTNHLINRAEAYFQLGRYSEAIADAQCILFSQHHIPAITLLARCYNANNKFDATIQTCINYCGQVKDNREAGELLTAAKLEWIRTNILPINTFIQSLRMRENITVSAATLQGGKVTIIVNADGTGSARFDWREWLQMTNLLLQGGNHVANVEFLTDLRTDAWTNSGIIRDLVLGLLTSTDPQLIVGQIRIQLFQERNFNAMDFAYNNNRVRFNGKRLDAAENLVEEYVIRNTNTSFTFVLGAKIINIVRSNN